MSPQCPECERPIPADAPGGMCPTCAFQMAGQAKSAGLGPAGDAMPPVHSLRHRLPGLRILDLIGGGGMGAVYRAVQEDLDRVVAVKILPAHLGRDPRFVERFRREARAMAKLDHPQVATVFGSGVTDDLCYIVMEFIDGTSLRDAIEADALEPASALQVAQSICQGLAYAHEMGVVHRDIKPENVLLGHGGKVKIVDFGLAKLVDSDAGEQSLTATGARMGTLRYMAPEQFDGRSVDRRADIYSLGVMLYEMLTGEVPMGRFRLPSETIGSDPRIDQVIERTMQQRPDDRYQAISEVDTALSGIRDAGQSFVHPAAVHPAAVHATGAMPANTPLVAGIRYGRAAMGQRRYQSKARILGLPVIDVALGFDPQTGQPGTAKGIIAIGDRAYGGLAMGGFSMGVVSIGGCAIGINAFGGAAMGLQVACGGAALSGGLAMGGAALSLVALGGGGCGALVINRGQGSVGIADLNRVLGDNAERLNASETSLRETLTSPSAPYWIDMVLAQLWLGPLLAVLAVAIYGWVRWSEGRREDAASETQSAANQSAWTAESYGAEPQSAIVSTVMVMMLVSFGGFIATTVLNHIFLPLAPL
ncbi:MAG: serine/threonine-protein kinase [Planctomycetota bacterium]